MKNTSEIFQILDNARAVEAHVHTHLCDGASEMTVANVAQRAEVD